MKKLKSKLQNWNNRKREAFRQLRDFNKNKKLKDLELMNKQKNFLNELFARQA